MIFQFATASAGPVRKAITFEDQLILTYASCNGNKWSIETLQLKHDQPEIIAKWKCPDCPDFLCDECKKAHKKNRITREHILTEVMDTQPDKDNTSLKGEVCAPCKDESEDVTAKYYCQQCEDFLCEECKT